MVTCVLFQRGPLDGEEVERPDPWIQVVACGVRDDLRDDLHGDPHGDLHDDPDDLLTKIKLTCLSNKIEQRHFDGKNVLFAFQQKWNDFFFQKIHV